MFAKITKLIAGAVVGDSVEVGHKRFPQEMVFPRVESPTKGGEVPQTPVN